MLHGSRLSTTLLSTPPSLRLCLCGTSSRNSLFSIQLLPIPQKNCGHFWRPCITGRGQAVVGCPSRLVLLWFAGWRLAWPPEAVSSSSTDMADHLVPLKDTADTDGTTVTDNTPAYPKWALRILRSARKPHFRFPETREHPMFIRPSTKEAKNKKKNDVWKPILRLGCPNFPKAHSDPKSGPKGAHSKWTIRASRPPCSSKGKRVRYIPYFKCRWSSVSSYR